VIEQRRAAMPFHTARTENHHQRVIPFRHRHRGQVALGFRESPLESGCYPPRGNVQPLLDTLAFQVPVLLASDASPATPARPRGPQ